ncbi:MAG: DUF4272 domain-containing protein, partial [Gemmataceae bacterium]|nr:DUF4272 domain-containing protein [Gemmataceae bacterium]
ARYLSNTAEKPRDFEFLKKQLPGEIGGYAWLRISQAIICSFLPGLDATIEQLVEKAEPRTLEDVIAMEYRFYCAHNAVVSAQLGGDTVPAGFHPLLHGGAVHERRHSLTWCLSPGVIWSDTDLNT